MNIEHKHVSEDFKGTNSEACFSNAAKLSNNANTYCYWETLQRLVAIEQHCRDAWCYWETLQRRRGYVICSFKIFRNMFYVYLIKCAHSSKMWHGDYFTVADMFSILLLVAVMFFHTANLWAQSRNKVWRDCRYIIFIGKNLY